MPTIGDPNSTEDVDVRNTLLTIVNEINGNITAANLAAALLNTAAPAVVTSLPGSPVDGQEVYYVASATLGIVWHLKYRSASANANKWEYIGGPSLQSRVSTAESTATASTWVDLATVGPQVTIPLAGDYEIAYGIRGQLTNANIVSHASLAIGAATPAANDACTLYSPTVTWSGGSLIASLSQYELRNFAAGINLRLRYYTDNPSNTVWSYRWLRVTPTRVS